MLDVKAAVLRRTTVGELLRRKSGFTSGFDFLRLYLSLMVLYSHLGLIIGNEASSDATLPLSQASTTNAHIQHSATGVIFHAFSSMSVPMFFALSGFLVAASSERTRNVLIFLSYRVIRIFPALLVEVLLSAFLLGSIFTTLSLWSYVSSAGFWAYFSNCLGIVNFYLPGVFGSNPEPGIVNINLWTLPSEFHCYLLLSIAMITGILWNKKIFTALFLFVTVFWMMEVFLFKLNIRPLNFTPEFIVYYFFAGVFYYIWREKIVVSLPAVLISAILAFTFMSIDGLQVLTPFFVVYLTVVIGCTDIPMPSFFRKNDYSYGIYLYGFPISQALFAAAPGLSHWKHVFKATAILLTALFASFSWHLIESRALPLKRVAKDKILGAGLARQSPASA